VVVLSPLAKAQIDSLLLERKYLFLFRIFPLCCAFVWLCNFVLPFVEGEGSQAQWHIEPELVGIDIIRMLIRFLAGFHHVLYVVLRRMLCM